MTKYMFVFLTNSVEGKEDAFNDWYTNTHLRDVVAVPGVVSAQRFRLSNVQRPNQPPGPWKYLALYEVETDDLPSVLAEFAARRATPRMPVSDAMAEDKLIYYYEAITPPVLAADKTSP